MTRILFGKVVTCGSMLDGRSTTGAVLFKRRSGAVTAGRRDGPESAFRRGADGMRMTWKLESDRGTVMVEDEDGTRNRSGKSQVCRRGNESVGHRHHVTWPKYPSTSPALQLSSCLTLTYSHHASQNTAQSARIGHERCWSQLRPPPTGRSHPAPAEQHGGVVVQSNNKSRGQTGSRADIDTKHRHPASVPPVGYRCPSQVGAENV